MHKPMSCQIVTVSFMALALTGCTNRMGFHDIREKTAIQTQQWSIPEQPCKDIEEQLALKNGCIVKDVGSAIRSKDQSKETYISRTDGAWYSETMSLVEVVDYASRTRTEALIPSANVCDISNDGKKVLLHVDADSKVCLLDLNLRQLDCRFKADTKAIDILAPDSDKMYHETHSLAAAHFDGDDVLFVINNGFGHEDVEKTFRYNFQSGKFK